MRYVVDLGERPSAAIAGTEARFPVRRIFCVARNYAEHAREMGYDPDREPPFFFTKPADALVEDGCDVPYPPRTQNLHHEVELVVAIGKGGRDIPVAGAEGHIYGYAVGNDLTRRDLQHLAKKDGRPWDTAKGFDFSAPMGPIHRVDEVGHPRAGRIWLTVNGETRQDGDLAAMIWSVPEVIAELSTLYALKAGDLIFTGTPAGVGAVVPGDEIACGIDGLGTLTNRIA
ncbi:fumarylacetoacetate hydrolase family protein [Pedomonas sp. V897]|uniref:fumarylacetoacetate hydrolase family protein n=1 Tax=Pedomonas sp. V897 TaxID=3446482 RepID=UPI003EE28A75